MLSCSATGLATSWRAAGECGLENALPAVAKSRITLAGPAMHREFMCFLASVGVVAVVTHSTGVVGARSVAIQQLSLGASLLRRGVAGARGPNVPRRL
jgi:hypothetical protein